MRLQARQYFTDGDVPVLTRSLASAITTSSVKIVNALINAGADINQQSVATANAITVTTRGFGQESSLPMLRFLVQAGLDPFANPEILSPQEGMFGADSRKERTRLLQLWAEDYLG